jgi:hypothetical protein
MIQEPEREGEALKLRLDEAEDDEEDAEAVDGTPATKSGGQQEQPLKIHIVETQMVRPRKPSLVHTTTSLELPDTTKAQRR